MFFNSNGIRHRYDDIMKFTNENELDLILVVESHLKDHSSLSYIHSSLPAFSGESGGLIGGIAVLCRNRDFRKNLQLISSDKANLWLILKLDEQLIAVCYFPPSLSFRPHMMALMKELEKLSENWTLNVTIVGDFNARGKWTGDRLNTPRGTALKEIIQDFPVELCNPEQGQYTTLNTSGGKGITDLVFQTSPNCPRLQVHELESLGGSDHRPLTWEIRDVSIDAPSRPKWKFTSFHTSPDLIGQFQTILQETTPEISEPKGNTRNAIQEDIDAMWNNITEWLSYALKNSCGMLGRFRHHKGMFWTPELKAQSKQFNTVINELSLNTATQDGTLRLEKKILFNRYAKNRRKRHEELKRLQFDELCKTGNRGQFFRFVKKLRRPFAASSLNPKNMAQYVDHFKNTFGATPTGSEKHIDDDILEQTDPTKFHPGSESLAFTVEEVQAIVDRLGRNKAAGEDNLPAEAFYFGGDVTTEVLTKFFNILLKFHISPEQWNHSLVCLIYKRKGDASEVKNYRPISLTIVAKRIFEKAIDQLLEVYKSKLHRLQGGFRKRRSTAHQVYYLAELMQSYI
jgi:hypothetical protein